MEVNPGCLWTEVSTSTLWNTSTTTNATFCLELEYDWMNHLSVTVKAAGWVRLVTACHLAAFLWFHVPLFKHKRRPVLTEPPLKISQWFASTFAFTLHAEQAEAAYCRTCVWLITARCVKITPSTSVWRLLSQQRSGKAQIDFIPSSQEELLWLHCLLNLLWFLSLLSHSFFCCSWRPNVSLGLGLNTEQQGGITAQQSHLKTDCAEGLKNSWWCFRWEHFRMDVWNIRHEIDLLRKSQTCLDS